MSNTELVFHEFDGSRLIHVAPVRNPLLEVRLFGFLRGDAYVNPFHDLLYALSRSSSPEQPTEPERSLRQVRFTGTDLTVVLPNGTEHSYPYSSLDVFKLSHAPTVTADGDPFGTYSGSHLLQLTIATGGQSLELPLKSGRPRFRELLDLLYAHRVTFREFTYGMRSFMTDVGLSYRQVQEFKKKYGVEY